MGLGSLGYEMISPKIQRQECASEIMGQPTPISPPLILRL